MKKTIILLSMIALTGLQTSLHAQSSSYSGTTSSDSKTLQYSNREMEDRKDLKKSMVDMDLPYLFRAHEWSVDLFAIHPLTDSVGLYHDELGAGLGVNYFFSRYFGLGFDGYAWDGGEDEPAGAIAGNLIFRYPIERWHLAPYMFAGPGAHFGPETEVSAQGGAGFEYRFTNTVGLFADARYVIVDNQNNYFLPRIGVRFSF